MRVFEYLNRAFPDCEHRWEPAGPAIVGDTDAAAADYGFRCSVCGREIVVLTEGNKAFGVRWRDVRAD